MLEKVVFSLCPSEFVVTCGRPMSATDEATWSLSCELCARVARVQPLSTANLRSATCFEEAELELPPPRFAKEAMLQLGGGC